MCFQLSTQKRVVNDNVQIFLSKKKKKNNFQIIILYYKSFFISFFLLIKKIEIKNDL